MALDKLTKIQKIGINTTTIPTVGGVEGVGVITATTFIGDGSGLTGVTASGSGVIVKDSGTLVGTAQTIDFGTNLNISPVSAGIVTVTNAASATSLTGLSDVTVSSPSSGQVLKYNGSAFVNTADTNTTYSQSSVASGSNVNLRLTDSNGVNDDILITAGSNITFSSVSANGFTIASSGGGSGTLSNIVEDTTPELGGSLDLNNKFITGSGGINVSGVVTATSFTGNGANITAVNATTLDSIDSGSFLRSDATDTCSGQMNFTNQLITKKDGDYNTQGGVALVIGHATNSAMRANHFIHDNYPSGSGTYFIQVTESGVSNDRNMCLQGYGGKIKVGSITAPTEVLDVNGNVKATSFIGNGAVLSGVVTSIVAGANITLTGGPTGIVTIASSGGGGGGGISLSNGVDNRVVTAVGATVVNGEANLTFDGTTLALTGSQNVTGGIKVTGISTFSNEVGIASDITIGHISTQTFQLHRTQGTNNTNCGIDFDDGGALHLFTGTTSGVKRIEIDNNGSIIFNTIGTGSSPKRFLIPDVITHYLDTNTHFGFPIGNSVADQFEVKTGGTVRLEVDNSGVQVTGILTATSFSGALSGDVSGNVAGNVTGSSGSCTGNSATATEATNITVSANNNTVVFFFF